MQYHCVGRYLDGVPIQMVDLADPFTWVNLETLDVIDSTAAIGGDDGGCGLEEEAGTRPGIKLKRTN